MQLGAILTLYWPILKPILPQPVLLLAHLKPVFARLGRILAHLGTEILHSWKTNGVKYCFAGSNKPKNRCKKSVASILHYLGAILAQLGTTLTLSWLILELIFAQLAPSWLILGLPWHILDAFGRILEPKSQQK